MLFCLSAMRSSLRTRYSIAMVVLCTRRMMMSHDRRGRRSCFDYYSMLRRRRRSYHNFSCCDCRTWRNQVEACSYEIYDIGCELDSVVAAMMMRRRRKDCSCANYGGGNCGCFEKCVHFKLLSPGSGNFVIGVSDHITYGKPDLF